MKNSNKITVVIPTCNRSDLLTETIECIASQSRKADEVVVVNNGSDALTLSPYPGVNLKVLNVFPFCGASAARNYGAVVASGDILAFIDDDDLWEPDYLLKMEAALSGANVALARLDQLIGNATVPWKSITKTSMNIRTLVRENPGITGSNLVIRKDTFLKVGGFDVNLTTSEDKSLLMELLRGREAVEILSDCQAIHRQHDTPGRLTNPKPMIKGIGQFKEKYSDILSWKESLWLDYKISSYMRIDGQKYSYAKYWAGRLFAKFKLIP